MKVALVANGVINDLVFLKTELLSCDKIIAVDGGMYYLERINLKPDYWIGDMDSHPEPCLWQDSIEIIKAPVEKDFSDLELAIIFAKKIAAKKVCFYAVLGDRIDHTLLNISLLMHVSKMHMEAVIDCSKQRLYLAKKRNVLIDIAGQTFSIIPISDLKGVVIKGAKYPLNSVDVSVGSTRCLSNIAIEDEVIIEIKSGNAYIVINK